jgi:hypothetical protein
VDESRPDQWLEAYRGYAETVELALGPCRERIDSDPVHPLGLLINLCLQHASKLSDAVNRRDLEQCKHFFLELRELKNELPEIATSKPAFAAEFLDVARTKLRAAGHSAETTEAILEEANSPERGAPRDERWTAIRALWMHNDQKKSYPEIADALCTCGKRHGRVDRYDRRLDPCSERYRNQVRRLRAILKKYSR